MNARRGIRILLVCLLATEGASFILGAFAPDWFDHAPAALMRLQTEGPRQFKTFRSIPGHNVLGWPPPSSGSITENNCLGEAITYNYDAKGVRIFSGYDPKTVQILLIGDEKTKGQQMRPRDTIAANLWEEHRLMAANLGVQYFTPVQSLLRAQRELPNYPRARFVILHFIYDNIDTLDSSLHLVQTPDAPLISIRPYMHDGALLPIPPESIADWPAYVEAVKTAFHTDAWARPAFTFPYTLALYKAITAPAFALQKEKQAAIFHHKFQSRYANATASRNLQAFLSLYASWAAQNNLTPIVVFIPENFSEDSTSAQNWLEANNDKLPPNLIARHLPMDAAYEKKYNLKKNGTCTLSAFTMQTIASYDADILNDLASPP